MRVGAVEGVSVTGKCSFTHLTLKESKVETMGP